MKKTNYLNNKDILKEIHKSKTKYCWFKTPDAADYDMIVSSVNDISSSMAEAKALRLKRLITLEQDAAAEDGRKLKAEDATVKLEHINDTDVVFRVMTWEHIPEAPAPKPKPTKGKKAKTQEVFEEEDSLQTEYDEEVPDISPIATKYVKVNFPPFQHYQLNESGGLEIVGRSHWKGDLETGEFSKDHGQITNKLALMYIKLCERYATRYNWRNYTYNDEMRSQALLQLSQIGLQFDESKSANPFAYYTAAITNSFTRVLNTEKRNQNIRDDILEMNSLNPSFTRQYSGDHGHDYDE